MSTEHVSQVITRATGEPEFRELLLNNPDQALQSYELTADEIAALKSLSNEKFDADAGEFEERISRAGLTGLDASSKDPAYRVKVQFPWDKQG